MAAALFAVAPHALGGVHLRAPAGAARDAWMAQLRALLPDTSFRKLPATTEATRLLGGLDLAATLAQGRPVAERGLLAQADGGVLVVAMAERVGALNAALVGGALDTGAVATSGASAPARFGVIALDEGAGDDEAAPPSLRERLALHIELPARPGLDTDWDAAAVHRARALLPAVTTPDALAESLSVAALALGVAGLRAPWFATRVARVHAALHGRLDVTVEDCAAAAALVLGPRATQAPRARDAEPEPPPPPPPAEDQQADNTDAADRPREASPEDIVLAAASAALPHALLAGLAAPVRQRGAAQAAGKQGHLARAGARGRPAGTRARAPGPGARLNVIETLRAAAPWQGARGRKPDGPLQVRREDFRVTVHRPRGTTTALFVVDASGSAALARLAEAKGAVETLLAECYVRRDRVALIAFRGRGAQLLLAPTRSLVRAKRELAGLPGGGGTPLASGIALALETAAGLKRRGDATTLVFLTDGAANVSRDGVGGRERADAEAQACAKRLAAAGHRAILIDSAARPQARAAALAQAMGARYVALPHRDPGRVSAAVLAS
jgi:magnesium chelatase subunit D